ncbi:MAG: DoxX family protein [Blastocatellia bacterium]|nr:DoxX family protein [Blastocatellia bacterium]
MANKITNKIYGDFAGGRTAIGLLAIRLVFGLGIALHGWGKIQNPFSWMGPDAPVPGILQALAALSEFGGGIALILGLLTPLALLGLASTMIVAITTVHANDPFVARGGGRSFELAALYLTVAVAILLAGPGKFSLDALLFTRTRRNQTAEQEVPINQADAFEI